jgi:hypothetical protein
VGLPIIGRSKPKIDEFRRRNYLKTLNEILTGFLASDFEIALSKSQLALLLLIYYRLYTIESQ